jgi:lysozyme
MPDFDTGINRSTRRSWSGGRDTPSSEAPLPGFHTGIVMDDADDQRMGQVWVYIPGVSQRRIRKQQAVPTYGGTAPDRDNPTGALLWDQNLRMGWIQCAPLLPFFGGDDFRVSTSPGGDFRNAGNGDVNAYGFWAQPRIGDEVGVLFAHGDAAKGYWIGCMPKYARNFMVPGNPGRPPEDLDEKIDIEDENNPNPSIHKVTKQIKEEASRTAEPALVPAMDKARRLSANSAIPVERELVEVLVAPETAQNLQKSGLLCDVLRGAGTSSSRRESPSYVFGFKSAGWNFDSEKGNLNTASGERVQFGSTVDGADAAYKNINTTGHQLTFDDHPDHQGIRLRTSAGSQLYFSDRCNEPFIYIATAQGNVWIEMIDNGKINIFSEDSVSIHSRSDINLTADRDINIDAQRDLNVQVRRDTNFTLKGQNNWELGKNDLPPKDLKYNTSPDWGTGAPKDTFIHNFGNVDWTIDNDFTMAIDNNTDIFTIGNTTIQSSENIDVNAGAAVHVGAGTTMDLLAQDAGKWTAGTLDFFAAGGNITGTGTQIHFNGPQAATAGAAANAVPVEETVLPITAQIFRVPTEQEVLLCKEPPAEFDTLNEMTVPQHQPWPERCKSSAGTRGFVDESPTEVSRVGSTTEDAETPLNLPEESRFREGQPFSTTNESEAPFYNDVAPRGDFAACSTYSISDKGVDFLHRQEGFRTKAYPDADGYSIGYGHFIRVGNIINGDTINGRVTQTDIDNLRRTKGQLNISSAEADRLFREDLVRFEEGICNEVSTNITQGQFDAMVSFSYNGGRSALRRMVQRSAFNTGNFSRVPQEWMKLSTCSRCPAAQRPRVESALRSRRRQELEILFAQV